MKRLRFFSLSVVALLQILASSSGDEILIVGGEHDFRLINGTSREHVRLNHVGLVLPNSSILIMGGRDMDNKNRLKSTAILNLNDGSYKAVFRRGPDMNDVRSGAAAVLYNGEATICGGVEGVGPRCPLTTCERLVDGGSRWTYMEPMLQSRGGLAMNELGGKLYAVGGESWQGNCKDPEKYTLYNTAEKYDPATKKWELVAPMKTKRFLHTSAVYKGKMYVCGGQDGVNTIFKSCEIYDPASNTWSESLRRCLVLTMDATCIQLSSIFHGHNKFREKKRS